jgi:hypothetical protein
MQKKWTNDEKQMSTEYSEYWRIQHAHRKWNLIFPLLFISMFTYQLVYV